MNSLNPVYSPIRTPTTIPFTPYADDSIMIPSLWQSQVKSPNPAFVQSQEILNRHLARPSINQPRELSRSQHPDLHAGFGIVSPQLNVPKSIQGIKTCVNCSSMESRRWYRNPDDSTTKICNSCYRRIKTEEAAAIGTTCAIDSCKRQKNGQWYKNPKDPQTKICSACYQSIHLAKKAEEVEEKGTTCAINSCKRQKSGQWYENPKDPQTKICNACYQSIYRAKKAGEAAAIGTTCAIDSCKRQKSVAWYKNPKDAQTKICNACYRRIKSEEAAAIGITCAIDSCKRQKNGQWYKNPKDPQTKICSACYRQMLKKKKKLSDGNSESSAPLKKRRVSQKTEPPLPVGQQIFAPEEQLQPPVLPAPADFPSFGFWEDDEPRRSLSPAAVSFNDDDADSFNSDRFFA